jgi:hypothetical protein
MDADALIREVLAVSPDVRYVAVYHDGRLASGERPGLAGASSSESDRYEELIVNPAILTLVRQRGNIDCGGARFVLIRYGSFYELVVPIAGGHLSVGLEAASRALDLAGRIEALLAGRAPGGAPGTLTSPGG